MKIQKSLIGKNYIYQSKEKGQPYSTAEEVTASWNNVVSLNSCGEKLRVAQRGALFSIKAHWTVSSEPATIVMPTGTGKTETMIATVVSEMIHRTLIIVPSDLLRKQTAEKFFKFGILQEVGVIEKSAIRPVVAVLKKTPSSVDELKQLLDKSNVIITTMSLLKYFDDSYLELFSQTIDALIVDEAHHIAAKNWATVKYKLRKLKCLQFTATPFRNDGKKVDGKIIYNFPLSKAQEQGFFQKINFQPLMEFDDRKSDMSIAVAAVNQLDKDLKNGYNHVILVRAKDKKSADRLYCDIYDKYFKKYNPVLIHSGLPKKEKEKNMLALKNGKSKIVVCVDMFGEGIDVPNLKIAAIHDKYKSLPITLQFVGRFARTSEGLGDATIITNIADDELSESLAELYSQDSDWNMMLNILSDQEIGKEISLQNLAQGFDISSIGGISIEQLKPKVSMIAYHTDCDSWNVSNLCRHFDADNSFITINNDKKIIAIVEKVDSNIEWSSFRGVQDTNWHLHLIYWNQSIKTFFVNSTVKGVSDLLAGCLFNKYEKIQGEMVFRCLNNINRLMLGTVGLKSAIDGPIRYKMFAGVDIGEGIAQSQKETSTKSNLFGSGYDGKGKVSIGCSYKGTIWSKWVDNIEYWANWCDDIAIKLNDKSIDTDKIFEGALIPEIVHEMPDSVPYSIEWPYDMDLLNDNSVILNCGGNEISIYEAGLSLIDSTDSAVVSFSVCVGNKSTQYDFFMKDKEYCFVKKNGLDVKIKYKRQEILLEDFFKEYPPRIKFANQSILEGNYLVKITLSPPNFDYADLIKWDWNGTDISKESQGYSHDSQSIQYKVIQNMISSNKYSVIFDDDSAGEVADVICIEELPKKIIIHFIHCKFSHEAFPGARINDLYEVCGQAEKSVKWCQEPTEIIERMIKRETKRTASGKPSRFEVGDLYELRKIRNKMRLCPTKFEMSIVQPGVDGSAITDDMKRLLNCTKSYLKDTYSIDFKVICS